MKVSAPASPVPDSPAPVAADAPAPVEIQPGEAVAAPPVAMAKWPDWFKPIDLAMAILVIVLAFLLASFTARNTDIWRHLGTGRLLFQGHHPIGGDPLSYTGGARAWVNSNWLFDAVMYVVYSADDSGVTAVVLKACAFAAAFAVLFLLRRPEQSLWPWAVAAALGVIATGSMASLRPYVFGMAFQSVVLALIYRANWAGPKWRLPAILGGVCWLWACTDSFYFIGPLTILLIWGGERLHRSFTAGQPEGDPTDDPFWAAPADAALLRALLLSVGGVLLNPMFLGALVRSPVDAVTQLVPFELTFGWGDVFTGDTGLTSITLSPLSDNYYEMPHLGYNVTGFCALGLVILSGLLLGAGLSRLRATHVLLWFAFVVLGLLHYRFIPAAALMAIPLAAGHLNGLSRFRLQTVIDPSTKLILNLSGVGRIVSVAAIIALVGSTVPGHLHAKVSLRPEYNRRVSWGVEEDVGLARGARLLQEWRTAEQMPEESHGMLAHYDFGDYCAWFAPREKVFLNSRFRFHGPELLDLYAIRGELQSRPNADGTMPVETAGALMRIADTHRADYLVLGQAYTRLREEQIYKVDVSFTDTAGRIAAWLHIDGRVAIASRTDTETGKTNAANLRFTPARTAFAPGLAPIPSAKSLPPRKPVDSWIADFIDVPQPGSVATDDAFLFASLARLFGDQTNNQWIAQAQFTQLMTTVVGGAAAQRISPGDRLPSELELTFPLMASRAARRAIVETPDDPEPYLALSRVSTLRYTGILNIRDNALPRMTSLRRFLDRIPATPNGEVRFSRDAIEAEYSLFLLHLTAGQMDLALDSLARANARIKSAPDQDLPPPAALRMYGDTYRQQLIESRYSLAPGSLEGVLPLGDATVANAVMALLGQRIEAEGLKKPTNEEGRAMYRSVVLELANSNLDAADKTDKTKPLDAAWVRTRSQALEDRVKREIGKRNEAYTQQSKAAGLAQKFMLAVQTGFFARAMDMIFAESDWDNVPQSGFDVRIPRQFLPDLEARFSYLLSTAAPQDMRDGTVMYHTTAIGLNIQAIVLQFESGQLDMAAQQLENVTKVLDKAELENTNDPRVTASRAAIKQLRTLQARLEGNFDAMAEDKREQLQQLPKLSAAALAQVQVPLTEIQVPLAAAAGSIAQIIDPAAQNRYNLTREAVLYYDLGTTALHAGDNVEARKRFAMALQPQGLPVKHLGLGADEPLVMFATRYLDILNRYADGKPAQ